MFGNEELQGEASGGGGGNQPPKNRTLANKPRERTTRVREHANLPHRGLVSPMKSPAPPPPEARGSRRTTCNRRAGDGRRTKTIRAQQQHNNNNNNNKQTPQSTGDKSHAHAMLFKDGACTGHPASQAWHGKHIAPANGKDNRHAFGAKTGGHTDTPTVAHARAPGDFCAFCGAGESRAGATPSSRGGWC